MDKLYLFFLILLTGTVYAALWNSGVFAISMIILLALFLKDFRATYNINLLGTYIILSGALALVLFAHFIIVPLINSPLPYIGLFTRFISVGLFYVYVKNKKVNLSSMLQSILTIVAIHAVLAFILSFFVTNYLISINTEDFYTNTFGYLFYYNSDFPLFGFTLYRNQGIFWEPGILQIYMNILFFISSFVIRNKKLQFLAAFLILTTYSTTGIGILLLQLIMILFSAKATKIQKALIIFALSIGVVPVFVLNYTQKLDDGGGDSDITSSAFRVYDLLEGIQMTREYPITGIGLSQDAYVAFKKTHNSLINNYSQEFTDLILERRSSNSVMLFLTRFGIPFSLLWFFMLFKQDLIGGNRWLLLFIIIAENFSEPLLMEPFFILFAASGLYGLITIRFKKPTKTALKLC